VIARIAEPLDRVKQPIPAKSGAMPVVVPVVRPSGVIGAVTRHAGRADAGGIAKTLQTRFPLQTARAVALVINSPGGSPCNRVQIYLRMQAACRWKRNCRCWCSSRTCHASGGYMIACAGDEIFCDPSSIPRLDRGRRRFRFSGLDQENWRPAAALYGWRAQGDAGSVPARDPDDVARLKALQREIHAIFIALVKGSRGARLKGSEDVLFTGEYWAGEKSVSLGLADKIGDIRSTLRERYGEKVLTPVIAPASGMLAGLLGRKSPGAGALAAFDGIGGLPDDLISALETRAIWAKFGF
jgi:serine protease SohB